MAFREKITWISLVTLVVIYGGYFVRVVANAGPTAPSPLIFGSMLASTVVLLIVTQIVLTTIVAVRAPREANAPMDEHERLIELKGTSIGFYVLVTGALAGCVAIGLGYSAYYTANGLFFAIVLAEIVRTAGRLYFYRAGV